MERLTFPRGLILIRMCIRPHIDRLKWIRRKSDHMELGYINVFTGFDGLFKIPGCLSKTEVERQEENGLLRS